MGNSMCREACLPNDFRSALDEELQAAVTDEHIGAECAADIDAGAFSKDSAQTACGAKSVGGYSHTDSVVVVRDDLAQLQAMQKGLVSIDAQTASVVAKAAVEAAIGAAARSTHAHPVPGPALRPKLLLLQAKDTQDAEAGAEEPAQPCVVMQQRTDQLCAETQQRTAKAAAENGSQQANQEPKDCQQQGPTKTLKESWASAQAKLTSGQERPVEDRQAQIARLEEQAQKLRGQLAETHRQIRAARQDPKTPIWLELAPDRSSDSASDISV